MKDAFQKIGLSVIEHPYFDKGERSDAELESSLAEVTKKAVPDFVFSFNYFPVVAMTCKKLGLPYVAWIYDSPYVRLYHYSINYPTNYIFVFDKEQFMEFHNAGINTVHYLPMAANVERLNAMQDFSAFQKTDWCNQHEVAFIGSLYTEKHQFFERLKEITPYTRGYLDGLMAAQNQIYCYNFIQQLLPKNIIEDMQNSLPMQTVTDSVESI